jgi:filamentous hemagglutinin
VSLVSQGDMTLKGGDIQAGETLSLDTDGMLKLLTATDEHFYRKGHLLFNVLMKKPLKRQ